MEVVIRQRGDTHGFSDGVVHARASQFEYTFIPRVGDTVIIPAFLPGLKAVLIEFSYEAPDRRCLHKVVLDEVTVWVS